MALLRSKKSLFFTSTLVLIGGVVLFLLFTDQPLIKLMRFTVFNAFELTGDDIGTIEKDIVYKTVDEQPLLLDLYMPLEKKYASAPVVVFSHGGGWVMGDRETMLIGPDNKALIIRLRRLGYAIANFEYRLLGEETNLADLIADNKDMIRWLRLNADEYGLDPDNIGLWGQSAGGHLVLMAGMTNDDDFIGDAVLSATSAKVNYIVNNYGLSDLVARNQAIISGERMPSGMEKSQFDYIFEDPFEEPNEAFINGLKKLSAVSYIDKQDPPVLSLHGDADRLVPADQTLILQNALERAGVEHETHLIANADHIFNGATPDQIEDIVSMTIAFIQKYTIESL